MKRILPAVAAATLFLAPFIRADEPAASPANAPASQSSATDGDPMNSDPAPDLRAERRAEMLKRFDTNGDGKLDATERAAMHAAKEQKHAERAARMEAHLLKRYDKNGDGVLDTAEQNAALADLETRPRFIARFDKDGDGKLNDVEKANAENVMRALFSRGPSTARNTATPPAASSTNTPTAQ